MPVASRSERERIDRIYRDHGHVVLRRAKQLLGNDDEARDVLQDLFMSLIGDPDQFLGRSSITTWLYSATTHFCLNKIRNRKTRARLLHAHVAPAESKEVAPRGHALAVIRCLLECMPENLAQAAIYYYVDEMSQDEISQLLGCSRRHVGHLLERAHAWAQAQETSIELREQRE